ncbi:nadph2 dehydrogenase [Fusarium longipes]|uniref:Nadph2 dehydrogenase n=1 Tax=Fusarium longipes TaxID=694270 RepID=A0A395SL44_9HYPO|nr:nadph2 dehydrogenase [Fusarium longipes]
MISERSPKLFEPTHVGSLNLKHRVVLAPLTRGRANASSVPAPYAREYYSQRATEGGLLITEGTFIHPDGAGRLYSPGIYSSEQIEAWKHVTSAVHAKGGLIVVQLWALGRIAEPDLVPFIYSPGSKPYFDNDDTSRKTPDKSAVLTKFRTMEEADIDRFVEHYQQAALNAMEAGFDGVELHGANGYLIDQFLQSNSNDRQDQYGGSVENRIRFPLRVVNAISEAIGPERVGVRMSPFTRFQGMREVDPLSLFVPWAQAIVDSQPSIAYIHAIESRADGAVDTPEHLQKGKETLDPIRDIVNRAGVKFIVAGGFTPDSALAHTSETNDLVAFGRHFIPHTGDKAKPDLPARIKNGWPLTKYDRSTFYKVNEVGYSDYRPHGYVLRVFIYLRPLSQYSSTPHFIMSTQQTARTQYVHSSNGAKFAYRQIGAALGTPLVVLTHFRGTMDKWDPLLINNLAAKRRVITVDYLGVGLSSGDVATSIRQSAADISEFLELIKEPEIDLLGFSIGGYVAQMVALNSDPSKVSVRKLVLAGTGTSYGKDLAQSPNDDVGTVAGVKDVNIEVFKTLFFHKNTQGDAAAEAWWGRIQERQESTCGEEVSQWLSSGYQDQGKGIKGQATQGHNFTMSADTSGGNDGAYNRLSEIKIPVLVANGNTYIQNDYMIPTSNSYLIFQKVPNAQLILYPNSGHGFLFQWTSGDNVT